jgi:hypothetical protein
MSGQFYDGGKLSRTYGPITADFIGAANVDARIQGPAGKVGRVRGIEYILTTGVTVAASSITVGVNAAVAPASCAVPIAAINTGGAMTAAELAAAGAPAVAGVNDVELPADTVVEIGNTGGSTAGAGLVYVTIDWF